MRTSETLITPEIAKAWLLKNSHNRPIIKSRVETFAKDIRTGNWQQTHQGVAFSPEGVLLDGQHRLMAIVTANVPVKMNVTQNLPTKSQEVIDGVRPRSIGDVLTLTMGLDTATLRVAITRQILRIIKGVAFNTPSVSTIKFLLDAYQTEIELTIRNKVGVKCLSNAPVLAAMAFAMKTHQAEIVTFEQSFFSGENLSKGDPVLALRNFLFRFPHQRRLLGGETTRSKLSNATFLALKHHVSGTSVTKIQSTASGEEYFRHKQSSFLEGVLDYLKA
jgi:hypothetical protein